jgi:hypothetical protein
LGKNKKIASLITILTQFRETHDISLANRFLQTARISRTYMFFGKTESSACFENHCLDGSSISHLKMK